MSKKLLLAVPLACGIVGLAVDRQAASETPALDPAALDVPQLYGFAVTDLTLPPAAGVAFDTAVALGGQPYVLTLEPRSVRSADFQLLVDHGDGVLVPVEPNPPATYGGSVVGLPGSLVAASVRDGGMWATIVLADGTRWHVEPLSELIEAANAGPAHVIYRDLDAVPADKGCGTDEPPMPGYEGFDAGTAGGVAGTGLQITEIACDADVEYWQENGSDVQAVMADIENVINSVGSTTYEPQASMTFEVSTIVVRTGDVNSDPYTSSSCGTLLNQFKSNWDDAPEVSIKRDVAQLYTGRNLSDCLGIAYVATVCESPSFGFGYNVVESQSPGLSFALRVGLSAHEIGHNFNAGHCCGSCSGCNGCRIMCPCIGGCSGIVTSFGSTALSQINSYIAGQNCFHDLPLTVEPPYFEDFPDTLFNNDNWMFLNGAAISSAATNEPSPPNSMHLDAIGSGEYQDNEARTSFINLEGREGQGFEVQFFTEHKGVEAGEELLVDYRDNFHRWIPLTTVTSDGNDQNVFTEHVIPLDGLDPSPFHDEFRLRFLAAVDQSNDEWYIDDIRVGGEPAPANDNCSDAQVVTEGTIGFSTLGATSDGAATACDGGGGGLTFVDDVWFEWQPSCSGEATISVCNDADFDTRIAVYFAGNCPFPSLLQCNDDAAGCGTTSEVTLNVVDVVTYIIRVGGTTGEGTGNLTISCGNACPADLTGDGNVGIEDFLQVIGFWGGPEGDIDGDGTTGIEDFLAVIGNWGPC